MKKILTFKEKMKIRQSESNKDRLRNIQTAKSILLLSVLISLYIIKFDTIYWLIYPLFLIHLIKLCWIETYEDKTKVTSKDAFWGYYTKVNEFVSGKGCNDEDIEPYFLLNPLYRIIMVILSLIYVLKMKSRSIYMNMFLCISSLYLFFSYEVGIVRDNIISEEKMYGGNLYFALPLAILLYLEYKNHLNKKDVVQ